jgi:hypothetical protein
MHAKVYAKNLKEKDMWIWENNTENGFKETG